MKQLKTRRAWVLALVFGAATVFGSVGMQAGGVSAHHQAGYLDPPPPQLVIHP